MVHMQNLYHGPGSTEEGKGGVGLFLINYDNLIFQNILQNNKQ
jgi:hypothetical protein